MESMARELRWGPAYCLGFLTQARSRFLCFTVAQPSISGAYQLSPKAVCGARKPVIVGSPGTSLPGLFCLSQQEHLLLPGGYERVNDGVLGTVIGTRDRVLPSRSSV